MLLAALLLNVAAIAHHGVMITILTAVGLGLFKSAHLLIGMTNQTFTGTPTSRRFAKCPSTVVGGQAVLLGGVIPAVALDSYSSLTGGTTFSLGGSFNLSVFGQTVLSPPTNAAIGPGGKVYADGGALDATTNVKTGFSLDGNTSGVLFGYVDPEYTAGVLSGLAPDTAAIVLLAGVGA